MGLREKRRHDAIRLVESGWSQAEVARRYGVSREAVRKWVRAYRAGGPAALAARPIPGARPKLPRARLPTVAGALARGAAAHGFPGGRWTARRIAELIARDYGVSYHPNHVRRLFRDLLGNP